MSGYDAEIDWPRVSLDLANKVEEAKRLLMACLNTGALRVDEHRKLYEEICRFCGIETK